MMIRISIEEIRESGVNGIDSTTTPMQPDQPTPDQPTIERLHRLAYGAVSAAPVESLQFVSERNAVAAEVVEAFVPELDAAYQRGLAEGRRQAADAAEEALRFESDRLAAAGTARAVEQGIGAVKATNHVRAAILQGRVGPWETAEQPEPTPAAEATPSMHWQCTRCGLDLDGNPRFCPRCSYTVYRPIHHEPATGGVVDSAPEEADRG